MANRISPYTRLQRIAQKWAVSVLHPQRRQMFLFPTEKLGHLLSLDKINQRVLAAQKLGYRVEVVSGDQGLDFQYVKQPDALPWEMQI